MGRVTASTLLLQTVAAHKTLEELLEEAVKQHKVAELAHEKWLTEKGPANETQTWKNLAHKAKQDTEDLQEIKELFVLALEKITKKLRASTCTTPTETAPVAESEAEEMRN